MAFRLDEVVPWGRSYEEYVAMFALSAEDLRASLLGCSDGPASFNCEHTRRGGEIISIDPLYAYTRGEIESRIGETFDQVLEQVRANEDEFVWTSISSPDELGEVRLGAMNTFLADVEQGRETGRYVAGGLPELSFTDNRFDIALCSHFLFLYSEQLSLEFHLKSILELCRVAREVRLFPLLELGSVPSRHLGAITELLAEEGIETELVRVDYEFQRGGDTMMKCSRRTSL